MKQVLLVLIAMSIAFSGMTQSGKAAIKKAQQKETSDPKAVSIVKKVKAKYDTYKTMKMDVKITIKDGSNEEKINAKIAVKGTSNFRMETTQQDIITNGKTVWTHIKGDDNQLQIADYEEEELGIFGSPAQLLENYSKDYIIALIGEATENGRTVYKIECKPKDRYSDITKVRFTIDKSTYKVKRVKVFERSNIHYTLSISKFYANPTISNNYFIFNTSKVPKGNIVDMRF